MSSVGGPAIAEVEAAAVDHVMAATVAAGSTLTGSERRQLALRSRQTMNIASSDTPIEFSPDDPVGDDTRTWLVDRLTVAAHTIRPSHIAQLADRGLGATTYVEILGLVARLQAVDTFCFGIGAELPDLPEVDDGEPTGIESSNARIQGGWVPTVGPASPPNALSLITTEHEAMHDLHCALYLSVAGMGDLDADRGLHRTQMEFVAARTSLLNECFF